VVISKLLLPQHVVFIVAAVIIVTVVVVVIIANACRRPLLPGASPLEPRVIPTTLKSFHIMCDVTSTAVFCSESTECFPHDFQIFL
jgi:hypothetical protein